MRKPRPLKHYDKPDIPTLEEVLEEIEPPRRRFLRLAGAGVVAAAGGGLLTVCKPCGDDDTEGLDDDSGTGDDDTTPGDDDDDTPWDDDDDGGIDDDDSASYACRLPKVGEHQVILAGGELLTYSVLARVTAESVTYYLQSNEDLAFEVLDAQLGEHDCVTLPDDLWTVASQMAFALTELIRDVGGFTCSVESISIDIVACVEA